MPKANQSPIKCPKCKGYFWINRIHRIKAPLGQLSMLHCPYCGEEMIRK